MFFWFWLGMVEKIVGNETKGPSWPWIAHLINFPHKMDSTFSITVVPTCDPPGGASFDPRGIIWIELIKVHKAMLHTTNQSSKPSRFREEKFWTLPSLFLCSNLWPQGGANLDPQGHHMNKLGRGQQGNAAYQISKLYAFHFQKRTLKMGFFVSMFQLVTPGVRPVLTPGISYEQTW